jgi:hypothetical protein
MFYHPYTVFVRNLQMRRILWIERSRAQFKSPRARLSEGGVVKGRWKLTGGAASVVSGSSWRSLQASRRALFALLLVLSGTLGSMPLFTSSAAAESGTVATVIADGAPLLAGHDDTTVIDYMEYGATVDVLFGPYNGMYEILYYGQHGWTWTDKLDTGGGASSTDTWSEQEAASVESGDSSAVE